jgi:hypothetical protein
MGTSCELIARSALECGGSTPPWNGDRFQLDQNSILRGKGSDKGGVEPPHSKALRAG